LLLRFFVLFPDKRMGENFGFVYLVTNRHVAQPGVDLGTPSQVQSVFIRLNLATPQGGIQSIQEQIPFGGRTRWFFRERLANPRSAYVLSVG
jgi:hypothetical protein